MNPLLLLNWRLVAGVIFAVLLTGSHWKAYHMGGASVQAKWNAESLSIAKQSLRLSEEATRTTTNLEAAADQLRGTKNAQIRSLDARVAELTGQLRDRPSRPREGDLPAPASPGPVPGCTGAGLYREDASAFIGEAARANRLLANLAECQALYNKVRNSLMPNSRSDQ